MFIMIKSPLFLHCHGVNFGASKLEVAGHRPLDPHLNIHPSRLSEIHARDIYWSNKKDLYPNVFEKKLEIGNRQNTPVYHDQITFLRCHGVDFGASKLEVAGQGPLDPHLNIHPTRYYPKSMQGVL